MNKEIVPTFKGTVKEGRICVSDPMSFNHWLIKFNGKQISIKVTRFLCQRTGKQNNFYWKYLTIISEELTGGETPPEYYHEYFKRIFLDTEIIKLTTKDGEKNVRIPGSTTELDKWKFSKYLMKIENETGIPIPDPQLFGYDKDIYSRVEPIKKA